MEKFSENDLQQIERHGLSLEEINGNIETFEQGIPYTELIAPATLKNGIKKLSDSEIHSYIEKYDTAKPDVIKFVPASGAATRMFKDLQVFLQKLTDEKELENQLKLPEFANVRMFFDGLPVFPFYQEILPLVEKYFPHYKESSLNAKAYFFLRTLLDLDKANFSTLPKGLVPFHEYTDEIRTAFEEHFHEAAMYCAKNEQAKLHFTVAEEHAEKFEKEFQNFKDRIESKTGTIFEWQHSVQEKTTDTLAVDLENMPFRNETGDLCFRPAGHGALLGNLNRINADIVFIKNIDNVATKNHLPVIATYKKALAGILIEIQEEAFRLLRELHALPEGRSQRAFSEKIIQDAKSFSKEKLNIRHEPTSTAEIIEMLNRPIRICGMVENAGAPGGGPFWIKDGKENTSLQIVETAQIDLNKPQQKEILEKATHFNPVDLICGLKNYKGEKFDLFEFANPKRGFISQKSANGRNLKALELPGLWNGSMEYWNTIFVEVPAETFNPVKTVLDLLRTEHGVE
ncbi:MAG TPA: DUF4301 family protein [Flavobacteriaceae bacterium]|nr:DUF4301 family protein [Flavobacteriaceae bacterium]